MNHKECIKFQKYRDKREDYLWDRECKRAKIEKFECTDKDIVNLD